MSSEQDGRNRGRSSRPREGDSLADDLVSVSPPSPSWIDERLKLARDVKKVLARYATTHLGADHGTVLQLASGTQAIYLINEVLEIQIETGKSLDLHVLTTNLRVMELVRSYKTQHPGLFDSLGVVLTGGVLHPSLHSLVGEFAARHVATEEITPNIVFLGAKGVSFEGTELSVRYPFQEQLSTQKAYATRKTHHRVVIFDHTKLGDESGWDAGIGMSELVHRADLCSFVTSWPNTPGEQAVARRHEKGFLDMLQAKKDTLAGKQVVLRFINERGEVHHEVPEPKSNRAKRPNSRNNRKSQVSKGNKKPRSKRR